MPYIYTHTVECYLAIKMEISPFVTTWMDLEGIMLSEISQREKDKYCMISLICGIFKKKLNLWKQRVEKWLPGGEGGGNRRRLAKGYKLSGVRWIKSEDLMYNMVTVVDNTV